MKLLPTLSLLIAAGFSLSACTNTAETTPVSPQTNQAKTAEVATAPSLMLDAKTCFRGPFSSHASWLKLLSEKKDFNTEGFLKVFPESYFNDIKQNVECIDFDYEIDGLTVEGYYLKPKKSQGKLPVVIYNRGGNGSYGHAMFAKKIELLAQLAKRGYLVIASQYRGGSPWRKNNGEDEFGGADVNDVVALIDIIKQMPDADPGRIAMMGWSRGVMQTYLAAKRLPELKALVAVAGVSDGEKDLKWRPAMEKVYKARVPGFEKHRQQELAKRSVINWVDKLPEAPILLLHGDADKRVNVEQSIKFAKTLESAGHSHELVIYNNDGHGLRKHKPQLVSKLDSWFKRYL